MFGWLDNPKLGRALAILFWGWVAYQLSRIWRYDLWDVTTTRRWLALGVLFVGGFAWWPWRARDESEHEYGSFGHWLSDRSHREDVGDFFRRRTELVAQDRVTDPDWDAVVAEWLDDDDDLIARFRLHEGDERTVPALERALSHPRCNPDGDDLEKLEFIFDRLGEFGSTAARQQALQVVAADGDDPRDAIAYLARVGDERDADTVLASLARGEGRTSVAVHDAHKAGRLAESYAQRLYPALLEALRASTSSFESWASTMHGLDATRAVADLVPDEDWGWTDAQLAAICHAIPQLDEAARDRLHERLLRQPPERDYHLAAMLRALARSEHTRLEEICDHFSRSEDPEVRTAAVEARLEADGMGDWYDRLYEIYSDDELSLNPEQKSVLAASWIVARVQNGGLMNVYSNGSGDTFDERILAFERIGAHAIVDVIRRADAVFGHPGPHADEATREDQVGENYDDLIEAFRPLESEFFADDEEALYCISRFVRAHADRIRENWKT